MDDKKYDIESRKWNNLIDYRSKYRKDDIVNILEPIITQCPQLENRKRKTIENYIKTKIDEEGKYEDKLSEMTLKEMHDIIREHQKNKCIILKKKSKTELLKIVRENEKEIKKYWDNIPMPTQGITRKDHLKDFGIKKASKDNYEPKKYDVDCIVQDRTLFELKGYQRQYIENFINSDYRGGICIAGMGMGKTLIGIVASRCFLDLYPDSSITIIAPVSILSEHIKTLKMIGADLTDPRYNYYTYEEYSRKGTKCTDGMVIIDEAHNFRTTITEYESEDENKKYIGNIKGQQIIEKCTTNARKILLLTATPLVNSPYDIEMLMAMIDGRYPLKKADFYKVIQTPKGLKDYFSCKIGILEMTPEQRTQEFPKRIEKIVGVPFTPEFKEKYDELENELENPDTEWIVNKFGEKNLKSFHNGLRRFINSGLGDNTPKIKWIINEIMKNNRTIPAHEIYNPMTNSNVKVASILEKYVIFTQFGKFGVSQIVRQLQKNKISFGVIDGQTNKSQRLINKNMFNEGQIRVLIITKAGAEGVDLKNCSNVIITEPAWNESLTEQAIARAIRTRSHHSLPEEYRKVNVYRVLSFDSENETDKKVLKDLQSGNTIDNKDISGLTIDLLLYIKSLFKQVILDKFYDALKKSDQLQNCVSKTDIELNNAIAIWQDENKKTITYPEKLVIKKDLLQKNIKKTIFAIDDFTSYTEDQIDKEIKKFVSSNKIDKARNLAFNYYPTPFYAGKLLIKQTTLDQRFDDIKILEPTAGTCHLVSTIMKIRPVAHIDVCEFDELNREFIKKIEKISQNIHLQEQPDFMKFQTSTRYDYIIMNPPFNVPRQPLSKLERTQLSEKGIHIKKDTTEGKNWNATDFIEHAYNFLKPSGELVAIMPIGVLSAIQKDSNFSTSEQFGQFLSNKKVEITPIPPKLWKGKEIPEEVSIKMCIIKIMDNGDGLSKTAKLEMTVEELQQLQHKRDIIREKKIIEEEKKNGISNKELEIS